MRELGVPFAGLFGACCTMAEGLALGAALCEGGAARNLLPWLPATSARQSGSSARR